MSISKLRGVKAPIHTERKEPISKIETTKTKKSLIPERSSFGAGEKKSEKAASNKPSLTRTIDKKAPAGVAKKEFAIPDFPQASIEESAIGKAAKTLAEPLKTEAVKTEAVKTEASENTKLSELVSKTGMETNQDLINHFYKAGGNTWDGAQNLARENGVDLNDLVRERGGAINTKERPVLGGELGQLAAKNGLHTNQDLINQFYKEGGGSWEGAQETAQKYGADLNTLVRDRQGTIRTNGSPQTEKPTHRTEKPAHRAGRRTETPQTETPRTTTATPVSEPRRNTRAGSIVEAARRELALGVREDARSNEDRAGNIRKYRNSVTTLRHNRGPEAWCADFVSYVSKQAGKPLGPHGKGFASVSSMKHWFKSKGQFSRGNPKPGDVVFFKNFSHVAIVEKVNRDGTVTTIEGNTGGRGGQGVHRKTRRLTGISGFGRP